jgi:hypothetical protein
MTDAITDDDIRRVDENVDPTALTADDVADEMPDDFSKSARQAFGERVAEQRSEIRASMDISKRVGRNPSSGKPQLKGPDGRFGPSADAVTDTRLESNGDYVAELDPSSNYAQKNNTTRFKMDTVDLDAGADSSRGDNW